MSSTMSNTRQDTLATAVRDFGTRWTAAEQAGDTEELAALTVDDFTLVGPVGFILDREQWLDRYRGGDFVAYEVSWEVESVRAYGAGAVVVIGTLEQRAAYRGRPADGKFRVTQVLVREPVREPVRDDAAGPLRLAGLHLSPIVQPPTPVGDAR